MMIRTTLASALVAVAAIVSVSGCAVTRGQETVGAYIDDAAITTAVKARLLDSPAVAGTSISVETLNGTVMLSGFAKNASEKASAERIAKEAKGVKAVKNEVAVRP